VDEYHESDGFSKTIVAWQKPILENGKSRNPILLIRLKYSSTFDGFANKILL